MPNGKTSQNIGDLGEAEFRAWCARNSLICNSSDPDRMGWDFFVEFPPEVQPSVPLDRQNDLKKALVQIKSSGSAKSSIGGKLSAFKRLVDADMPAFISYFHFDQDGQVREAKLLHIGKTEIAAILKRVRQMEAEGRNDPHKINLSLPLDLAKSLPADGTGLRNLLLQEIGASSFAYIKLKEETRRNCGYDEPFRGQFWFRTNSFGEELVDLLIGKIPEIEVRNFHIDKRRFGISLEKDVDRFDLGIITADPQPITRAEIILSNAAGETAALAVDMFAPLLPGLPVDRQKIRFSNQWCEFVVPFRNGSGSIEFSFQLNGADTFGIGELYRVIKFAYMFSTENLSLTTRVSGREAAIPSIKPTDGRQFSGWDNLAKFLEIICVALFKHRNSAKVTSNVVEASQSFEAHEDMFALLTQPGITATFTIDQLPPELNSNDTCVLVAPVIIPFKSIVYCAVVALESTAVLMAGNEVSIVCGQPRIIEDSIQDEGAEPKEALLERCKSHAASLQPTKKMILVPELSGSKR